MNDRYEFDRVGPWNMSDDGVFVCGLCGALVSGTHLDKHRTYHFEHPRTVARAGDL